jgi:hypothetical protein
MLTRYFSAQIAILVMTDPDSHSDSPNDHRLGEPAIGRLVGRIGIALILLSGAMWFSLYAIPFLPLTVASRTALAAAVFVGVQFAWWGGAALAGPQTVTRLRSWFRRRKKNDDSSC